jgi:16S rRNA (uracil1498-N3)-methyltransferase
MNLFYSNNIDNDKGQISLTDQENRHLIKVLRKSIGEVISVTDGIGNLYKCEIINTDKTSSTLSIINFDKNVSIFPKLSIAISLTKKTNRFEWFLEKATEIGIHEITPIISEHTEKSSLNINRSNKLLISAMKQSLRSRLPILNIPISFEDYVSEKKCAENNFIATCKKNNYSLLEEKLIKGSPANVLIGPEGGFSNNELNFAKNTNFMPISLGNYRYRTETAGISVCMIFSLINK